MQTKLWHKILIMLALTVALLIPITMINNLASERENRQQQVVNDIAASSAGPQKLFGPVLVVPYSEHWTEIVEIRRDNLPVKESLQRVDNRYLYFLPDHLNMAGDLSTETKQRGLFKVRSYVLNVSVKGDIKLPAGYGNPKALHNGQIVFGAPYVGVALSDMRGVLQAPGLEWAGKRYAFEQGSALPLDDVGGMHAKLQEMPAEFGAIDLPFAFDLKLRGIESLDFVPAGKQNRVELSSAWQHPSFYGRFLPDPQSQQIGVEGFRALWTVDALATNVAQSLNKARNIEAYDSFGIRLMEPINIYSLSDRASKYGFLFVCLTFAAIFLFEILKNLAIHPAQYALVGLALATFFLLLLSLSEHLDFLIAYLLATAACVTLIGVYLSAVLRSGKRGFSAGALLAGLFASLYGLLESEDNALMLGSLLMFALLSIAMLATRKLDWYGLSQPARIRGNDQSATL
ncbi:MAG: cell envelope integrity protein CreD [Methylococcaceae bacterium]|nr:cell envelope integrity protein CreD [Methylococcaceae bacterium]